MMRTSGASLANKKALESRVPKSDKYSHVQSRLATGPTADRVKYLTNRQVLRRRDETFMRISRDELAELFEEYEKLDDSERVSDNVAGAWENGPKVCVYEEDAKVQYDRPYLLLDVRTLPEYEACHMIQARNMPQRLLMQDKVHQEIYRFKNRDSTLIVLYCDDERLSAAAAQTLVHRGFDNVFVLTRGLCAFADAFPRYVEGDISVLPALPDSPVKKGRLGSSSKSARANNTTRQNLASSNSSRYGQPRSLSSAASSSSRRGSRLGGTTSHSRRDDDQLSRMSELSVADTVISRATARKARY